MSEPQRLITIKAAHQQQRMPTYRKLIRWTWRLTLLGIAAVLTLLLTISLTAIPSFRELENPNSALASEVLANNGEVLGRYFIENRVPVDYEDLSPHLVHALVATEDERFWQHSGVDAKAVARVIVRTILMRDQSAGGGSTVTQQLAKNLYSNRDFKGMGKLEKIWNLLYVKLREWITAIKIEKSYTKEEVLAMYLNQVEFVNNAYGIRAAAEVYFGKGQDELKIEEAATLVGMLQNPSRYNPNTYPERCIFRRMIVLYQMWQNGFLTETQYDSLKVLPLDMSRFKRVTFTEDTAPYMCSELKKDVQNILNAPECRKTDGTEYDIYRDGLRIHTTVDPIFQKYAEAAMVEHMRKTQKRFFEVWHNRDPWTHKTRTSTPAEIDQRKEELWKLIRGSDRYQQLRPKYLSAASDKIQEKYGFELQDSDILRMLTDEKDGKTITLFVSKGWLTPQEAANYRKIMDSADWPDIKKQWAALQAATMTKYRTKVKMKVFSWNNPKFETDTLMSPYDSLRYHRMFLQSGILAVDPTTSEVKAWVGGINFKYFQFDHVRTMRQVGSTFKPFVYSTAMAQQSISPCYQVYDQAVTIPARYQNFTTIADWTPRNSTGDYSGKLLTLKEALKNSVNSVSAFLMKQMGSTEPVRGLLNNLGVDSSARRPDGDYRIPKQPSICLGAADLTVWEMTAAYAAFANKGLYSRPYVIKKIEDKNGRVIYQSMPEERQALPANVDYALLDMLKYNLRGAPGITTLKSEIGGKTGTTNDYTDGWFMGVTPRLVVGTWVGGDDRWIRFLQITDGQGARMARPILANFIQRLEKDPQSGYDYNARFERPAGDLGIEIDCSKYLNEGPLPGDEEDFAPDIYNDEIQEGGTDPSGELVPKGKAKSPANKETFGDEFDGGG
ncbi:MAG: transglycosylase domain-containing protein [Saprospiraceae bacterium]|nr:transglycosylase domain-containing protein [Saprospiraceae bacterium]